MPAMDLQNTSLSPRSGGVQVRTPGSLRAHKSFSTNASNPFRKFPQGIGLSDDNVVFGLGTVTNAGAASGVVLTGTVSRAMVLRDLVFDIGSVRGRITAITAAGDALLQGSSVPISMFGPGNLSRPDFDIPVYTGTVTVTFTADAAHTADAGFSID